MRAGGGQKQLAKVGVMVAHLKANGFAAADAWLFAGALMCYTGIAKMPALIIEHTQPESDGFL